MIIDGLPPKRQALLGDGRGCGGDVFFMPALSYFNRLASSESIPEIEHVYYDDAFSFLRLYVFGLKALYPTLFKV